MDAPFASYNPHEFALQADDCGNVKNINYNRQVNQLARASRTAHTYNNFPLPIPVDQIGSNADVTGYTEPFQVFVSTAQASQTPIGGTASSPDPNSPASQLMPGQPVENWGPRNL